jgi:hypothetical protein
MKQDKLIFLNEGELRRKKDCVSITGRELGSWKAGTGFPVPRSGCWLAAPSAIPTFLEEIDTYALRLTGEPSIRLLRLHSVPDQVKQQQCSRHLADNHPLDQS